MELGFTIKNYGTMGKNDVVIVNYFITSFFLLGKDQS